MYTLHAGTGVCVLLIAMYRHRLSANVKAVLACVTPLGVGLPALYTLGFYSAGIAWIIVSCISAAMFFKGRISALVIALEMLAMLGFAWAYTQGLLVLAIDANEYIRRPHAWIAIIIGTGTVTTAVSYGLSVYSASHKALMDTIREQHALITHQATHDGLTGLSLPHLARDRLSHAMEQARRDHTRAALLFIDLDGFKAINDTCGHDAGDHVLKTVAQRLLATLRAVDSASRQGGDEFMVLLGGISNVEDAESVAHKLVEVIAQPMVYQGQSFQVSASIGIAVFPDHADSLESLIKQADNAMYQVKKGGKNSAAIVNPLPPGNTPDTL
jgi:diguanylate cyclase (GGDEF)-like protein